MAIAILFCTDCEDIVDGLPKVDMVLTDPPFGISNIRNVSTHGWSGYTSDKGKWDVPPGAQWIDMCVDTLRPGGIFSSFGVYGSLVPVFIRLKQLGMTFQSHCIWEKSNPAPSFHRRMYTHANEIVLVFSKGTNWTFHYDVAKELGGGKQLKNVWRAGSSRRKLGRTRKPKYVVERLVLPLTSPGDWILDPFCGTSSLLEIAVAHGRNVIGIDSDPEVIQYSRNALAELGCEVIDG